MESIDPKYNSLKDLLNNRIFIIPEYQRTYSWEKQQRDDLFLDIEKTYRQNESHFMATVVCLKTNKTENVGSDQFTVFDIVDGQQRLTTLVTILKAIQKNLSKKKGEEKNEAEKLQKELLVRGKNQLIILQTNHDEYEIFKNYLIKGKIPHDKVLNTLALKNLCDCFIECEDFIEKWKRNEDLIKLLGLIKNNLGFIFYQLSSEKTVYTVFEVLNSRGLPVNSLDKAKSVLMGALYDIYSKEEATLNANTEIIKEKWKEIYRNIGINEIKDDDVVTFSATLLIEKDEKKGKLLSTKESLNVFRDLAKKGLEQIEKISDVLLQVSINLRNLKNIPIYKFFYEISQVRFLYVSLYLNSILKENEKKNILWYWEKASFRIYGLMNKDAKKCVGDYIRLGRDIFHNNIQNPFNEKDDEEKENHINFSSKNLNDKVISRLDIIAESSPIDKASQNIENENCYDYWSDELKYFMFRYEIYLSRKINHTDNINQDKWNIRN